MHPTSQLYREIASGPHRKEVKVSVAGVDYGMDALCSLSTARAAFGSGSPQPGLAPAGEIRLSLYPGETPIPRMAELRPYVRVCNDSSRSEWLPKGIYYIDTRSLDDDGVLTLHGFDAMLKAERDYPASVLSWPAVDLVAVTEIAGHLGISVDSRTVARMTGNFPIPLPASCTLRETLQYIAALYGGSFVLSDAGELRLVCLRDPAPTADLVLGSAAKRIERGPAFPPVSGVRFLTDSGQEITAGDDTGYVVELRSPWATAASAAWLLDQMRGFVYQPLTAVDAVFDPAAELGDTIEAGGILSGLFSEDITFDSLYTATVGAPADEELDHEYPYSSAQDRAVTRRFQTVQSQLTLQAREIAARVTCEGGEAASFGWTLDAEGFDLRSRNATVFHCDEDGVEISGRVNATGGNIGGCSIENGVLRIANANIDEISAGKITAGTLDADRIGSGSIPGSKLRDYTIGSTKIDDSAAVTRVIGDRAVTYGKSSYQSTLDQVGTNKANIDTLYGYFTGTASFSALNAASFWLNNYRITAGSSVPINGVNYHLVTWNT